MLRYEIAYVCRDNYGIGSLNKENEIKLFMILINQLPLRK